MLSNDVKALAPGQGCPAAFLDAHGKVMALLHVYALADRLLLELPAGLTQKTLLLLDKYLISEKASFEPVDEAWAVLSLQGPGAPALLATVVGRTLDLAPHAHVEATLAGADARVVQRAEFGVLAGYFIWTAPSHAGDIRRRCARRAPCRWTMTSPRFSAWRRACPRTGRTSTSPCCSPRPASSTW